MNDTDRDRWQRALEGNREIEKYLEESKTRHAEAERQLIAEGIIPPDWLTLSGYEDFWLCIDKIWERESKIRREKNIAKEGIE